jgi:subtilisin family serine protease
VLAAALLLAVVPAVVLGAPDAADARRDILVTFDNSGALVSAGGAGTPYKFRKRYQITGKVRRASAAVAREHSLIKIDHWPIRSLSVYCFVYRVAEGVDRNGVVALLNADERVESAQLLQQFETLAQDDGYNDPYANMQVGLEILDITAAHRKTLGAGVRIAIVDSHADVDHEDLKGRIRNIEVFSNTNAMVDAAHGTAVASVIGARSNNALGIVGVAPEATLDVFVSCWHAAKGDAVVCDSFSLSKALDRVLDDPPQVLNLSLTGPQDVLVGRLLEKVIDAGVIVVAASPTVSSTQNTFPSSMPGVMGIGRSLYADGSGGNIDPSVNELFAPGDQIMVAIPDDQYDFRSGSSLAAAHVSGVVALLLAVAPGQSSPSVRSILLRSQNGLSSHYSINACEALKLTAPDLACAY